MPYEPSTSDSDRLLETLYGTVRALIRRDGRDLTARQLAVFLICDHEKEPQTVRGLAEKLNIPRAAISRNLRHLERMHLVKRHREGRDLRSMHETRTARGQSFLRECGGDCRAEGASDGGRQQGGRCQFRPHSSSPTHRRGISIRSVAISCPVWRKLRHAAHRAGCSAFFSRSLMCAAAPAALGLRSQIARPVRCVTAATDRAHPSALRAISRSIENHPPAKPLVYRSPSGNAAKAFP